MKVTRATGWMAGSAALAGLFLAGLCVLRCVAPGNGEPWCIPNLLLLGLFWMAYVCWLVSGLVWLGGRFFGRMADRTTPKAGLDI